MRALFDGDKYTPPFCLFVFGVIKSPVISSV